MSLPINKLRKPVSYWVSEWLLFNAKWEIFQLYHGENKWWWPLCTRARQTSS